MVFDMLMTKEEYKRFKAQYELMGKLEDERQLEELHNPNSLDEFVYFLEEAYDYFLSEQAVPEKDEEKINGLVYLRKLMNRHKEVFG